MSLYTLCHVSPDLFTFVGCPFDRIPHQAATLPSCWQDSPHLNLTWQWHNQKCDTLESWWVYKGNYPQMALIQPEILEFAQINHGPRLQNGSMLNHQQVCGHVDFYSGSMSHLLRKMTLWKIFIMFIHVHYCISVDFPYELCIFPHLPG